MYGKPYCIKYLFVTFRHFTIRQILTQLRFVFLCEFAQIWRGGPANRKSPSTVLTTHGNRGHRISIVTVLEYVDLHSTPFKFSQSKEQNGKICEKRLPQSTANIHFLSIGMIYMINQSGLLIFLSISRSLFFFL